MKMLTVGAVLATLVASPAFAQSYDPDLGSGNIAPRSDAPAYNYNWSVAPGDQGAFARVAPRKSRARSPQAAYGAVSPFGTPGVERSRGNGAGSAREAALRECSGMARSYQQTTWANMEMHQFRTCMMRHGQPE
jgi:hypothetical protein